MSQLGIVSIAQPLYNIYNSYLPLFNQYGTDIRLTDVFFNTAIGEMMVQWYDSIIEYQKLRANVKKNKDNANSRINSYFVLFLTLFVIGISVAILILFVLIFKDVSCMSNKNKECKLKKENKDTESLQKGGTVTDKSNEDNKHLWLLICYKSCAIACFIVILVIGIIALVNRNRCKKSRINCQQNTDLSCSTDGNNALIIGPYLGNVFEYLLPKSRETNPCDNNLIYIDYGPIIEAISKPQSLTDAIQYNMYYVTLYVLQKKNMLTENLQADLNNYIRQRETAIKMLSREGANSDIPFLHNLFTNDSNWHPIKLYRDIQQLDAPGLINTLGTSVQYLENFILLEEDIDQYGERKDPKEVYIDNIIKAFTRKYAATQNFVFSQVQLSQMVRDSSSTTLKEAMAKSLRNENSTGIYYFNNNCYLLDTLTTTPVLFYQKVSPSILNSENYVLFLKYDYDNPNKTVIIAGPYAENSQKNDALSNFTEQQLTEYSICVYDNLSNLNCKKMLYSQNKFSFEELFDNSNPPDTRFYDTINNFYGIPVKLNDLVDKYHEVLSSATVVKGRQLYTEIIKDTMDEIDPRRNILLTDDVLLPIISKVSLHFQDTSESFKQIIKDILLNAHSQQVSIQLTDSQKQPGNYITPERLREKLQSMDQVTFYNEFVRHCNNVFLAGRGLNNFRKFYNDTDFQIRYYSNLIESYFIGLLIIVILVAILFIVRFILIRFIPKLKEENKFFILYAAKDKSKDNAESFWKYAILWSLITSACIGILIILLAFIKSYETRVTDIAKYNKETMDQNAYLLRNQSEALIQELFSSGLHMRKWFIVPSQFIIPNDISMNWFDNIARAGALSYEQKVSTANVNIDRIHKALIDIIDANSKCNALMLELDKGIPFPTHELVWYFFILIVCAIIIAVAYMKLEPHTLLENIRYYTRLKESVKPIENADLPFKLEDKRKNKQQVSLLVAVVLIILIPIIAIIIATSITNSAHNLSSGLLSSELRNQRKCYNS